MALKMKTIRGLTFIYDDEDWSIKSVKPVPFPTER